jgi:hypothetical protein
MQSKFMSLSGVLAFMALAAILPASAGCSRRLNIDPHPVNFQSAATAGPAIDVKAGTTVPQVELDDAREMAMAAFAAMFINVKSTDIAQERILFNIAIAGGRSCVLTTVKETQGDEKRWVVSDVNCDSKVVPGS